MTTVEEMRQVAIGNALDRAIDIIENDLPNVLKHRYEWKRDALALTTSNAFTVRQTAAIVGRTPAYVADYVRAEVGLEKRESGRTMFGVAGKLNLSSLARIRTLRMRIAQAGEVDAVSRAHIIALVDEGNGLAVLCHLLGINTRKTRRLIQYYKEKQADDQG